jgi:hypothetical protein
MNSGRAVVVLDFYDWLPSYGENGVTIRSDGSNWTVEIAYEEESSLKLLKRELLFQGVCCFYCSAFPGPPMLGIRLQAGDNLGALLEYPDSDAATAWKDHFGGERDVRHYVLWFLSENLTIQAFARDVVLKEPAE